MQKTLAPEDAARLAQDTFGDMVKVVVDIERGVLAAGGMLHADAEALLLDDGSERQDIWGANYFPARQAGARLECTALINIRPSDGNPDQLIGSEAVRSKVAEIVERWMGPL